MPNLKYASLTFVSKNKQKHEEYCSLLGIANLDFLDISAAEPHSMNLETIVGEKVRQATQQVPDYLPFFVEHTALVIDEWKGLPGGLTNVFLSTVGNVGICKMMKGYKGSERLAKARVVIAYYYNGDIQIFHGEASGCIASEPRGKNNFGWAPIFIPDGASKTYAEMSFEEKNQSSMRKKAVDQFKKYLDLHFEF